MNNKLIAFGVTFLLLFVFLSGCNDNNNNNNNNGNIAFLESKMVGIWRWGDHNQLTFYANKTGVYNEFLMNWTINGNVLTLEFITIVGSLSSDFFFSNNYNTLTLYDAEGGAVHYKRQ